MGTPASTTAASAPPAGWDRETPKYRATRDLAPAFHLSVRFGPPRAGISAGGVWQYGHRRIKAGEVFESREWPHPSLQPLNESGRRVQQFFNSHPKNELPWRPWREDRVVLNDGLTSSMRQKISINGDAA